MRATIYNNVFYLNDISWLAHTRIQLPGSRWHGEQTVINKGFKEDKLTYQNQVNLKVLCCYKNRHPPIQRSLSWFMRRRRCNILTT